MCVSRFFCRFSTCVRDTLYNLTLKVKKKSNKNKKEVVFVWNARPMLKILSVQGILLRLQSFIGRWYACPFAFLPCLFRSPTRAFFFTSSPTNQHCILIIKHTHIRASIFFKKKTSNKRNWNFFYLIEKYVELLGIYYTLKSS